MMITEALHDSWTSETSYGGMAAAENPARGQCVVSSLVIQDFLGGELRRVKVQGDGVDEKHYFNMLDDGTVVDTTAVQYDHMSVVFAPVPVNLGAKYKSAREKLLDDSDTKHRYELLRGRVDRYLTK